MTTYILIAYASATYQIKAATHILHRTMEVFSDSKYTNVEIHIMLQRELRIFPF